MFSNSDYELCAKAIFTLSFPNCKEGFFIDRYAHYYHFSLVNTMSSSDHVAFRDQAASAKGKIPLGLHLEKVNYHSFDVSDIMSAYGLDRTLTIATIQGHSFGPVSCPLII